MTRDLSTVTLDNISRDVVNPFFAIELLFDGNNVLRLWTGQGLLTLADGTEWVGTGSLLNISSVEETTQIQAVGATITLSGVPSEVLSLALQEPYQGRVCNIYFGTFSIGSLLQENGSFILQEDGSKLALETGSTGFNEIFSGYMDEMNINEGPDTSTIELKVENRLIDLERARVARFTSGYQKSIYPNDLGLDFVESLQDRPVSWGKATT